MAEGQFSPDLLLTVGADLTALRQQLATIQREIGATPLNVGIQPQQTQQIAQVRQQVQQVTQALNDEGSAVRRVGVAVDESSQAYRRLIQLQIQATGEDRQRVLQQIAAEKEYQATIQQRGSIQASASSEDVARIRQRGLQQIRAEKEYQAEIQRTALLLERQAGQVQAAQARLSQLQQAPAIAQNLQLRQSIQRVQGQVGGAQASVAGGVPLTQIESQALRNSIAGLNQEIRSLGVSTATADGVLGTFFSKLGRYTQIAVGLTLVYGAMRAAFAGAQEFVEVDRIMARIAATMERGADRTVVLRGAYELMAEANRTLGTSFSEAGGFILELEKSLGNNIEQIRAAFLPALTLVSIGEGNQTEILRTLIGLYKVFGDVLGDTSPQEKYLRISDALIASSAASIQDIDGFRTALQNVAPVARQSNVSLGETLALLVQLTNGMQSASRAGTGLRHLFDELQTRPQVIAGVFGLPFDPDQPLNAAVLLDQVIRKIREIGTDSLKARSQIQAAFPDERSRLAVSTLVALYAQYPRVLDEVSRASGRTAEAQRNLANTVSAAAGRLSGALFDQLTRTVDALSGVKPGQASGFVGLMDTITNAVRIAGEETRKYISDVYALLALLDRLSVGSAQQAAQGAAGSNVSQAALLALASPQAAARLLLPPAPEPEGAAVERLRRQRIDQDRQAVIETERGAALERGGPRTDEAALRLRTSLTRELEERKAELLRIAELEYRANSRDVDIKDRIAAAEALLTKRTRERIDAEREFLAARGLSAEDIARTERAKGGLQSALQVERRIREQIDNLRREDTLNQVKALNDQEDRVRKFGHLVISTQETITARRKIALGDEVAVFQKGLDDQLRAATANLEGLTDAQQEQVGLDEYRTLLLENLRKIQVAGFTDAETLTASLSGQLGVLREIFRQMEAIGGVQIAPTGFQSLDAGIQAIIDKTFGFDKITASLREIAATMGLVGEEAARATVAAKLGFESFAQLLELANRVRERERAGVAGLGTSREEAAVTGVPAADRAAQLTREQQVAQARQQVVALERDQRVLQVTFGKTTEESIRQSLAIRNTGRTFEELSASVNQNDRDYAEWIDRVARATAEGRRKTEVLLLMAAGFDKVTASMIATTNEADRLEFQKLRQAAESIEEFNTRAERMQEAISKIAQESARASGDPFAFFTISLKRASDQANEFWASLKTLAEDTAKSMSQSLSDFFFDSFQEKLTAGKDAWKSFLGSMERALADFMSKQLVRSFLNILTGGGSEASTGVAGIGGAAGAGALGGIASGFGSIGANYSGAGGGFSGVGAALFGLPATPTTVRAGLPPSNPEIDDPTSLAQIQTMRQATSGLLGSGGQVSRDLAVAGVIAAAYTTSQSVLKLTNEISTQQDRNSGTGGIAGTIIGGLAGAYFGGSAGAALGAGAGGLAGSFLGGLFGSDQAPAGRFDELARTIGTVQTSLEAAVAGAKTFTDLYNVLLGFQGGGALAAATQQPVSIAAGGQAISGLSQEAFLTALRANPSSLIASVQAGVSPELLGPINQEVVQTILAKVAALDDINRQISLVIAEISSQTIAPATGINSFDTLKEQAVSFRATIDQLIAANQAQVLSLEDLLRVTTDPGQILQYTTEIKALIEDRYRTEAQLVQQFAGQLDSLATSLRGIGKSIDEQIFQLELSNFGPTNPLQGYQLAQGRFDTAQTAFAANPTPENAQALQQAVDPLLKAASEVFTRPSPEYRAIFAEIVDALETVKISVDSQASDIEGALQAALGTSISIQDLTQRNTAAMASDMRQLLAIVQAQAAAAGVGVGAGMGFLNPATNPPPGGQVTAPTSPAPTDGGSQTGALLAAVGTIGALAGPLLTIADRLGATDYLKNLITSIFTTTTIGEDPFPAGTTVPTFTLPSFTLPSFSLPTYDYFASPTFDYSSFYGSSYPSYDYGYLAEGGPVPGSGMGDTVRAMLEPGEFVVRRDAAARNREWLEQINGPGSGVSRRGILHFQTGGMVPATGTGTTAASPEDIAILLYLQSILGGSSAEAKALLAKLIQQAQASQTTTGAPTTPSTVSGSSPSTPSTVSGTPTTATPSTIDPTVAFLQQIQGFVGAGRTVASLFGDIAGVPPSTIGAVSSVLGVASGGLGLFAGIQNDDPFATAAGGVTAITSIYNLLAAGGLVPTTGVLLTSLAAELGIQLSAAGAGAVGAGVGAAIVAAIQIAQIASQDHLSDEEKAIQATKALTTGIAVALAPATFGASLAVLQIWDFAERLRAGQDFDRAIVSANDPTAIFGFGVGGGGISDSIFLPSSDWLSFGDRLADTLRGEWTSLQSLVTAIPYVTSQAELSTVMDLYNAQVRAIGVGGYGEGVGQFQIQGLPGAGGSEHEGGLVANFDQYTTAVQDFINMLLGQLPATGVNTAVNFRTIFTMPGVDPFATMLRATLPDGTFLYGTPGEFEANQVKYQARTIETWDPAVPIPPPPPPMESGWSVDYIAQLYGVDSVEYQNYYQNYLSAMASNQSSGGLQAGGWVPGVSRGADSVPMWLEPGEFVVPRAVAKANAELLMSLLGEGGGSWDGLHRSDFGGRVSSAARELVGGSWDGLHRTEAGSTISMAARSGDYREAGGVSSVALNIAEGAIRIDGARDPKAVSRDVLEAIEQNIRTGRLGQVIAGRVRPQRAGV